MIRTRRTTTLFLLAAASTLLWACSDEAGDGTGLDRVDAALQGQVVNNYAYIVHASYSDVLTGVIALDDAIDAFLAAPSEAALEAAKTAWLAVRDVYGQTEAYRFYGGPIDAEDSGVEGLVNAWPLDEAYIDYVEGDAAAGLVNDEAFVVTTESLAAQNEQGGDANISTGFHAIEFLLWGQDLDADGPGARSYEDYTTAPNADRRGEYLAAASDLLVENIQSLVDAWEPDTPGNYLEVFLALDRSEAIQRILIGVGSLGGGELAGERLSVAYEERSQEDEHSCFSDNTTADIVANARGIQNVWLGSWGPAQTGPGLRALVEVVDPALAGQLTQTIASSVGSAEAIPAPFDQHLRDGVPDSDPGRTAIKTTIDLLYEEASQIAAAADALGLQVNLDAF